MGKKQMDVQREVDVVTYTPCGTSWRHSCLEILSENSSKISYRKFVVSQDFRPVMQNKRLTNLCCFAIKLSDVANEVFLP